MVLSVNQSSQSALGKTAPGLQGASISLNRQAYDTWYHQIETQFFTAEMPQETRDADTCKKSDCVTIVPFLREDGTEKGLVAQQSIGQLKAPVAFRFLFLEARLLETKLFDEDHFPRELIPNYPGEEHRELISWIGSMVQRAMSSENPAAERKARMLGLARRVFLSQSAGERCAVGEMTLGQQRVAMVRRMILDRPEKSWTLSELAQAVGGISNARLANLFREMTGTTIINYLRGVRVYKSLDLIRRRQGTLSDVAVQVGFYDQSAFNNGFRKVMGISPGEFSNAKTCWCASVLFDRGSLVVKTTNWRGLETKPFDKPACDVGLGSQARHR